MSGDEAGTERVVDLLVRLGAAAALEEKWRHRMHFEVRRSSDPFGVLLQCMSELRAALRTDFAFPEPEYVDCTCGHPNDDHNLGECPFIGCGCGVIDTTDIDIADRRKP